MASTDRFVDVSAATAMTIEDVCATLTHLNMIEIRDRVPTPRPLPGQSIKTIKGRKSGVARKHLQRTTTHDDERVKGPFVAPTSYTVSWDRNAVEQHLASWEAKGYLKLKPENLKWSPFLIARARKSDGLPYEDGIPQSATEVATPSTDALVTPIAGPSSEGGGGTGSPAFALFDDDNVEITRGSPSSEVPVPPSPSEDNQVLRRSAHRSRRYRSSSPPDAEGEVTPRPKRPRRSTASTVLTLSASIRNSDRRTSKRTRPLARPLSQRDDADLIAEDAALAARLAMEEDPPRRQLRSRSNTEQEPPRPISPSTPRSISSPRKRKRVESPPSTTPTARQTRSSGLLPSISRPTPSRRSSSTKSPSKRRRPQRRASKLTREVSVNADEARSAASPSPDPDREPEPPASPTPSVSVQLSVADPTQTAPEAAPDCPADPEPEMAMLAIPPVEDETGDEDTGTPLTGATSRQSVGHSDDTVFAAEEQPPGAHKVSPPVEAEEAPEGVAALQEKPPSAPNGHVLPALGEQAAVPVDAEEDLDIDAEGEEDAEGDIDAEGEDDIDAEGEPDTGEDLDLDSY